jgi:hypothetical protein
MSHFLTVPINENGVVTDGSIQNDLTLSMRPPFNFSDVLIYSHGWWTSSARCMGEYNRFTIEFAKLIRTLAASLPKPPQREALGIGVHWPSMLSEDDDAIVNYAQALSFYTMEKRADTVGEHAVYSFLRMILEARSGDPNPLRLHWIGHSFGCKVVCSALQEIIQDGLAIPATLTLNAVLLQAALDDNDLESEDIYGKLAANLPSLRLLVTRSDLDTALQKWYPIAHLANFFGSKVSRVALGARGPTQAVINQFGGVGTVDVGTGFQSSAIVNVEQRLVVANLTPIHQSAAGEADSFSGHHSDIFHDEIYTLIAGFLFK